VDQERTPTSSAGAPQGLLQARVDEKGRLKLPVAAQQYLREFGDSKVFITSLDGSTARIYPNSVWESNLEIFQQPQEDPEGVGDLYFLAQAYGEGGDIDGQGRVLLPTNLRRELGLENETVWLERYKNRLTVYNNQRYEERKRRALQRTGTLADLERKGLR
jgi:MraZ protein